MIDNGNNDTIERGHGPFPETQGGTNPWEASETERGPFERRNAAHDRRGPSSEEDDQTSSREERRRRLGRRKADVLTTEAQDTLTAKSRSFVRRFREPIIGLTLAGVAVPLVNAGVNPATGTKAGKEAGDAAKAAADADRDLEGEVGDYWAESEADVVRDHTIRGAMTRWDIDQELAEKIYDYAGKNDIEPDMAYGLVFTESTFRERAVSHVGARGLTQLMPRTAQWLDPSVSTGDLFDPDVNLDIGFKYLRQLIDKYEGDVEKALTAYNRGPGTVDKILKRGGNPDNGYAGKVLAG